MRYLPLLHRLRQRPPKLRLHYPAPAPGVFGIDLGEAMAQLDWAELLRDAGLRGKV